MLPKIAATTTEAKNAAYLGFFFASKWKNVLKFLSMVPPSRQIRVGIFSILQVSILMHAFLIIGSDQSKRLQKAQEIALSKDAKVVGFSAKRIEEVRRLNTFLTLSPQIKTAVLIENIDFSTPEAANALLKNLEEKENFTFILTASSKSKVLPTITSRCELVTLTGEPNAEKEKDAAKFLKMDKKQQLDYVAQIKDRGEALEMLDAIVSTSRASLTTNENAASVVESALFAKSRLSANTNLFLQLTNFVISLE